MTMAGDRFERRLSVLRPPRPADREVVGDPFLEFRDVYKSYDGQALAVAGLDFQVARGEFVTLLGPSGSGKTTALMMLAGFEAPTAGDIRLAGRSVSAIPPHRRNIGVVFQNYALFPHMSVAENIAFPLRARRMGTDDIRERVERVLKLVRLNGFGARRPLALSGGQQQRVALARALVFDPDAVLMDEPLGALDRQLREQLQVEIKAIQKALGLTVVYVTHDQSEALTMSDRIAVFNAGQIQQIDDPRTLYDHPANAFVAGFIGESSTLKGVVTAIDGEHCLVRTDGGCNIRALLIGEARPGARATLSLRPERIGVGPRAEERQNAFASAVETLVYHGDHSLARLRLPGGELLLAHLRRDSGLALEPGETVVAAWRPGDCRAFVGASSGRDGA